MKIQSTLATALSGKWGNTVGLMNKGQMIIRTLVTGRNPQTVFQQSIRALFALISSSWRSLSENERTGWSSAVENFTRKNVFGKDFNLSGSGLHQSLNSNLLNIGEAVITTAPQPVAVTSFDDFSVVVDNAAIKKIELAFSPLIEASQKFILWATAPQSAGVSFVKSKYRIIGVLDNADLTGFDAAALYITKFGGVPPVGSKMFMKLSPISVNTGQAGLDNIANDIAV